MGSCLKSVREPGPKAFLVRGLYGDYIRATVNIEGSRAMRRVDVESYTGIISWAPTEFLCWIRVVVGGLPAILIIAHIRFVYCPC